MKSLNEIIRDLIVLHARIQGFTLLAVCPNSEAVLEAAVKAAAIYRTPMLFAATLNQVDRDGGYTGWTPQAFTDQLNRYQKQYACDSWLFPCLDHGGPWLKDRHTLDHLSYADSMAQVKESLTACVAAGYALLHIDPTVDRTLPTGSQLPLGLVVERTIELIAHAEKIRQYIGSQAIAYEVGTEEVHGGLVEAERFKTFLIQLKTGLEERGLSHAWPCFVVAQVGTNLHTTTFDVNAARYVTETLIPFGSLAKGHYTDWVANPEAYPQLGMGGANVGPEFTAAEYLALQDLERKEIQLANQRQLVLSKFQTHLQAAVVASGRWQKWLQPAERGLEFNQLAPVRQDWLVQTGARYVWTAPEVNQARSRLYENLAEIIPDPHLFVVDRIVTSIEHYIQAFGLSGFQNKIDQSNK